MIALLFLLFSFSTLCADMQCAPLLPQKHFRFDKLVVFSHSYVLITENTPGAQTQAFHDPDCGCTNLKEEQIAKIIQEVIRLKDNQKEGK